MYYALQTELIVIAPTCSNAVDISKISFDYFQSKIKVKSTIRNIIALFSTIIKLFFKNAELCLVY